MTSRRVTGHALLFGGAPRECHGQEFMKGGWYGQALCQCGALSPTLDSNVLRCQWHRMHKDEALRAQTGQLPVVLVDMDGPLADFDRLFFERCEAAGFVLDATLETQRHRFATDHIPDATHRLWARMMVNAAGWFADLPVTPGAVEGLNLLAERADVWICSKPLEVNPTCRDDKAKWLLRHFGMEWERRMILSPDKSMVRGDILLDDAPAPAWFDKASWVPVIYPTSWNGAGSKWDGLPRWSWINRVEHLLGVLCS